MRLVSEHEAGETRVRILACDECEPDVECPTRFLIFQARHHALWVALAWSDLGTDEALVELDAIVECVEHLPDVVERYLALLGLPYPALKASGDVCMEQIVACSEIPKWMLGKDPGLLWQTRRVVFGTDLERVPQALTVLERHYHPETPVLVRDA